MVGYGSDRGRCREAAGRRHATADRLQSNLRALDLRLSDEDLAKLATLADPPERYWRDGQALPWT